MRDPLRGDTWTANVDPRCTSQITLCDNLEPMRFVTAVRALVTCPWCQRALARLA